MLDLESLSFIGELNDQERGQLRFLALIRPTIPTQAQLDLIENISLNCRNPRILALISRTPHWLASWPVLQNLAENEDTPESIRRNLELAVSLFDLMREMDAAAPEEKDERAETIKAIYQQLDPGLKPLVKQRAKAMAKNVASTGTTLELPALPPEDPDWAVLLALPPAPVTASLPTKLPVLSPETDAFIQRLCDEDPIQRRAAILDPEFSDETMVRALLRCPLGQPFEEVYSEARWYFKPLIREAILNAPCAPVSLSRKIAISCHLVEALQRADRSDASLHRIISLFSQLEESEFQQITAWCKRQAPGLLRIVKYFYERLVRQRSMASHGLMARAADQRWVPLEDRVYTAVQGTDPQTLAPLLHDADDRVFVVLLENPNLNPKDIVTAIPMMGRDRVETLASHPHWGEEPVVQESLIHSVHLTESTALELLHKIRNVKALLDVLRDPHLPHLEVKRQTLERLKLYYAGLTNEQRVAAIKATGGEMLRHLPSEVLQDEATLSLLLADRQMDPGILLRLARNKMTPRSILELVSRHPVVLAQPAVLSELLLNPKTPRESVIRVWSFLSDVEKQQLLRNPHLPSTLRHLK